MTRRTRRGAMLVLLVSAAAIAGVLSSFGPASSSLARAADGFGQLPLAFEANRGQADDAVDFVSRGRGYSLFLQPDRAVFGLTSRASRARRGAPRGGSERTSYLAMRLKGARPDARPVAGDRLPGTVNYFRGDRPEDWSTGVPTFEKVVYRGVYRGVDVHYHGDQNKLEYDFVVAPGGEPSAIKLSFAGADRVAIDRRGNLVLEVGGRRITQRAPVSYQSIAGRRRAVPSRFELRGRREVAFDVGAYDRSKPLVIDPILAYSSYFGAENHESGRDVAVDDSGNVVITGRTTSLELPTGGEGDDGCGTDGTCDQAYLPDYDHPHDNGGYGDAYVAKLDPTGSRLVYASYIGGGRTDEAIGVAVDEAGSAYVTGRTHSPDFPTSAGSYGRPPPSSCQLQIDCYTGFVAKLDPEGDELVYSTTTDAPADDGPLDPVAIAVDSGGNAYVAGNEEHTGGMYTMYTAWLSKVSPDGRARLYHSPLVGSTVADLAVDDQGAAYFAGHTSNRSFRTTPGAIRSACGPVDSYYKRCEELDAFVAKLNPSGSGFEYATLLGGDDMDRVYSVDVGDDREAVVAGVTGSDGFVGHTGSSWRSFMARVSATGTDLRSGTILGPGTPAALALDDDDRAWVVGDTRSTEFPMVQATQRHQGGAGECNASMCLDGFVSRVEADGRTVGFSSYLGGRRDDSLLGVAADSAGDALVVGTTDSVDLPTHRALDGAQADGVCDARGGWCRDDAFVAKIETDDAEGTVYDDLADARKLAAGDGERKGSNVGATREAGEPGHDQDAGAGGRSVWFEWTAPADREMALDASASELDPRLAVYTGDAIGGLAPVARHEEPAEAAAGRLEFTARRGRTYRFALDGAAQDTGDYTLRWRGVAPHNDHMEDAQTLEGAGGVVEGSNRWATKQTGEPTHVRLDGYANGGNSVWYRWQAPEDGTYRFDSESRGPTPYLAAYRGDGTAFSGLRRAGSYSDDTETVDALAGETYMIAVDAGYGRTSEFDLTWSKRADNPRPANDDFGAAQTLHGDTGTVLGHNARATREPGEPGGGGGHSVWYRFHVPEDGTYEFDPGDSGFAWTVAAYSGDSLESLKSARSQDVDDAIYDGDLRFSALAGERVTIRLDGLDDSAGEAVLHWRKLHEAPAGDAFERPQPLEGAKGRFSSSFALASRQAREPIHGGRWNDYSVWFRWTAPDDGPVRFKGADAVFTGDRVDALTPVADGDGAVTFDAKAGTEYRVASAYYLRHPFTLEWNQNRPANDDFHSAQVIEGLEARIEGDMWFATTEPDESTFAAESVWYRWTAPVSGRATFSTDGSSADTYLDIYTGEDIASRKSVTYLPDHADSTSFSGRSFDAVAGTTYRIAVGSRRGDFATGDVVLSLNRSGADQTPPKVRVTSPVEGTVWGGGLPIRVEDSDDRGIDRREYLVDGRIVAYDDEYGPFDIQWDTRKGTDGPIKIGARSFDAAGNRTTSRERELVVDNTPPQTTIGGGPEGVSSSRGATFRFSSSEEESTFECSLDGGLWLPCRGGKTYENLADGVHVFRTRARDGALDYWGEGNRDATPAKRAWRISSKESWSRSTTDVEEPATTFGDRPPVDTRSRNADIFFSSTERGARFECRLDDAPWSACGSPARLRGLAPGPHVFRVRSIDAAGNVESRPGWVRWQIRGDETEPEPPGSKGPDTLIGAGPAGTWPSRDARFEFTSDRPGTFECKLRSAWTACESGHAYRDLITGPQSFEVRAVDEWGRVDPTPAARSFNVDVGPPDTQVTSGPTEPIRWDARASFAFSASEAAKRFECRVDGGSWTGCQSPYETTRTTEWSGGRHTFEVRATNVNDRVDPTPAIREFETVPAPDTAITAGPSETTESRDATFEFRSPSGGGTFECKLDGGAWEDCASPKEYDDLGYGSHSFAARYVDGAGTPDPSPPTRSWYIAPPGGPDTEITSGPTGDVNERDARVEFRSNTAGATFQCQLNGAGWSSCSSPKTYYSLQQGRDYQLLVRAVARGVPDASPAEREWFVRSADRNPPTGTRVTSGPSGRVREADASFRWSVTEANLTLECRVDAGAWAGCQQGVTYTGLSDGPHLFQVRAKDAAGNTESPPAERAWQVDTSGPDTRISASPPARTKEPSASFELAADEAGASFECRLDGGAWGACPSPKLYTGLADGPHAFEARARDDLGNPDPSPARADWTVDRRAPETRITAAPPPRTAESSTPIGFAADETGASFECRFDAGEWTACEPGVRHLGLGSGTHSFEVRALDQAGNRDATPARAEWRIDRDAPDTRVTGAPPTRTRATSAAVAFAAGEPGASFECRVNAGAWAPCASAKQLAGLGHGTYTFEVRALDDLGNADPTPARAGWTVDLRGPETSVTSAPPSPTRARSAAIAFAADDPRATFECRLNGSGWFRCSSVMRHAGFPAGRWVYEIRAADDLGNRDETPARAEWVVDLTAPETRITGAPRGTVANVPVRLAFDSNDPGSRFECRLDGGAWAACSSAVEYRDLAHGTHTFNVRATDAVGNPDATPATATWNVDRRAPDTGVTRPPPSLTREATAAIPFVAGEAGARFECRLDGGAWAACASPARLTDLRHGVHAFEVRALDAVGNRDGTPARAQWTVDREPPETDVTAAPPARTRDASSSFSFAASESGARFACRLDGSGWALCPSPARTPDLRDGLHAVEVWAFDAAGNRDESPVRVEWTIDRRAPDTRITGGPSGSTRDRSVTFDFESTERDSSFECRLDDSDWERCEPRHELDDLSQGEHEFRVRATDDVGNVDATHASRTFRVEE